jgi:uncharacterized membrane protein
LLPSIIIITFYKSGLSPHCLIFHPQYYIQHVVINLLYIQLLKHWWHGMKPVPIIVYLTHWVYTLHVSQHQSSLLLEYFCGQ